MEDASIDQALESNGLLWVPPPPGVGSVVMETGDVTSPLLLFSEWLEVGEVTDAGDPTGDDEDSTPVDSDPLPVLSAIFVSPFGPVSLDKLFSFFHFILLFWNQILICLSVSPKACAISILLLLVRYLL